MEDKLVLVGCLSTGLGRLGFAGGVLEWAKPFLGPAYAWTAAAPLGAVLPVPNAILLTLLWIIDSLESGHRMVPCRGRPRSRGELFRSDTKGEEDYIVMGGFESAFSDDPMKCRWYSLRVNKEEAPFLFEKGHGSRTIASSEMLATLVGIHLFCDKDTGHELTNGFTRCSGITALTDNLGNSYVTKKLMTTKMPLSAVLMQLTTTLARKGLWLDLTWCPREENVLADELTNEDFTHFSEELRMPLTWGQVPTDVMAKLLEAMKGFSEEIQNRKQQRTPRTTGRKKRRIKEVWD